MESENYQETGHRYFLFLFHGNSLQIRPRPLKVSGLLEPDFTMPDDSHVTRPICGVRI